MKVKILESSVEFFKRPFIKPMKLSSGLITQITEARASVHINADGHEAIGHGAIYLSDLWAWPDAAMDHSERDAKLRDLCEHIAKNLFTLCGSEVHHPLELGIQLHDAVCRIDSPVATILARAMCASPFDAAIHDAAGLAIGRSAFDFYESPQALPVADEFFKISGAIQTIRQCLSAPKQELDAWLIVGSNDPLGKEFASTVARHDYRCFKLKISGRDNQSDAARTIEVFRAALQAGAKNPRLSVDSNEANTDADSVLDYLQRLNAGDHRAFESLSYLEQPTARDIRASRYDWHAVAKIKPVLLDEGLTSLDLLPEAKAAGWSGLALKTCKGHSFALLAAAWAHQHGMLLSMQDLTNPGIAAIHAALLASRLNTINGVELNSMQFTPEANAPWLPRLSALFEPVNGVHRLAEPSPLGLGSRL